MKHESNDLGGGAEGPTAAIDAVDAAVLAQISANLIRPAGNNFVERPWGGGSLARYKGASQGGAQLTARRGGRGLDGPESAGCGARFGEAFEICADDTDEEAREYPSIISLPGGVQVTLAALLRRAGPELLGEAFVTTHGRRLPLLPKTLDIGELLSVQAHPEGFTEAYLILEAQPGATLRLGFREDVEPSWLERQLGEGLEQQHRLLALLEQPVDAVALQRALGQHLARREAGLEEAVEALAPWLQRASTRTQLASTVAALKQRYWQILELLNEIPVASGQVIYNATPSRIAHRSGRRRSAEVHALGNPEGREILALEIRRPAPTYRAWDHGRFPMREVRVGRALAALNLRATSSEEFFVIPHEVPRRPGVLRSVRDPAFTIDHLRPQPARAIEQPTDGRVRTLHAIGGSVTLHTPEGRALGILRRGESALVPASLGAYQVTTASVEAELIQVEIATTAS